MKPSSRRKKNSELGSITRGDKSHLSRHASMTRYHEAASGESLNELALNFLGKGAGIKFYLKVGKGQSMKLE